MNTSDVIDEINIYNNGDGTYSIELYMIKDSEPYVMKIPKAELNADFYTGLMNSSLTLTFAIHDADPFVAHIIKNT